MWPRNHYQVNWRANRLHKIVNSCQARVIRIRGSSHEFTTRYFPLYIPLRLRSCQGKVGSCYICSQSFQDTFFLLFMKWRRYTFQQYRFWLSEEHNYLLVSYMYTRNRCCIGRLKCSWKTTSGHCSPSRMFHHPHQCVPIAPLGRGFPSTCLTCHSSLLAILHGPMDF